MGHSFRIPASLKGPLWMLVSCMAFIAIWGLIRHLSATLHPFLIVFYRTLFAILAFLPFILRHGLKVMASQQLPLHALRGVFSFVGTLGLFYAVAHIPLEEAVAISYGAPVFAAAGAVLILKEKVRWRRLAALALGFAGVLVVLRPGFRELEPAVLGSAVGSLALAGSLVVIKRLSGSERPETIALYAFLFVLPASLLVALFFWSWPTREEFLLLLVMGALVRLAHTALARAFMNAEATAVLPLDFSRLVFASLLGVFVFGEPVDAFAWTGAAVILASTVYFAHREAVMARREKPKKPLKPLTPPGP